MAGRASAGVLVGNMGALAIIVFLGLESLGVWLLYSARHLVRLGLASYKWASTEGMIVDSSDASFYTDGLDNTGTGIVPVQYQETAHTYEYQVNGRTYRSSTFCFGGHAEMATAAYLVGTRVPVYYDPKRPEVAVLRRGVQLGAVFGIVPIAAGFFWFFLWRY